MSKAAITPVHLLIVDDDEQLRESLERYFRRVGAQVTTAASVAQGVSLAGRTRQDVALLDLHLPDGSGATFSNQGAGPWRQKCRSDTRNEGTGGLQ